jgi:Bacterial extracellular solute-binding protein/von Willebrand factor type A domain
MRAPVGRMNGRSVELAVLLVLTLLAVGSASTLLWTTRADEGPALAAGAGCASRRTVELAVSPALHPVVWRSVQAWAPACTEVKVSARSGGEVALGASTGGDLPDVWIPESRFWMTPTYLGPEPGLRLASPSLARTPLLLVGGPGGRRYGSWGDAEVSGQVSVPDPGTSTTGSLAVVAPQAEAGAVGRSREEARQTVVPFAQKYGERRARGLDQELDLATIATDSPRLVVTTEQELARAGGATASLRDLTPAVGAPSLTFPMALPQDGAPGSGIAARRLQRYLASDAGVAALGDAGLRTPSGQAVGEPVADVASFLPMPPARDIASTVQSWQTLSVPSAILAVVDASGSMDFGAQGGTRMELLSDAAGIGLSFLPDHARVGLWIFSIDKGGPDQDWRVLEPMRALDGRRPGGTQRTELRQWARRLPDLTDGGTGLNDTALAAYRQALRDYRPGFANAVVLMTDGENEDPGSISLDALVRRLRALRDPERPVRIVGIAISSDADLGALRRMAAATSGEAYLAAEPDDILDVFARAVLSR